MWIFESQIEKQVINLNWSQTGRYVRLCTYASCCNLVTFQLALLANSELCLQPKNQACKTCRTQRCRNVPACNAILKYASSWHNIRFKKTCSFTYVLFCCILNYDHIYSLKTEAFPNCLYSSLLWILVCCLPWYFSTSSYSHPGSPKETNCPAFSSRGKWCSSK